MNSSEKQTGQVNPRGGGRILWIDTARGIAIMAILIGHSGVYRPVVEVLYSFHVPVFFLLSGILFNADLVFTSFLRNKVKGLLIPYIGGYSILSVLAILLPGQETPPASEMVRGFFYANGTHGHWFIINLWFIPCLFLTEIFVYFYIRFVSKHNRVIRFGISFLIAAVFALLLQRRKLPWSMDIVPITQFLLYFGYEFRQEMKNGTIAKLLSIPLSICLFAVSYVSNGAVDLYGRALGNIINYFTTAILGSVIIIMVAQNSKGIFTRVFSEIGWKSLYIYIYHSLFYQLAVYTYHLYPAIYKSGLAWLPKVIAALVLGVLSGELVFRVKALFRNRGDN